LKLFLNVSDICQ